jgi:crotonobetainyl-CoA:carnitine CoA-transferase CaiB-like acyl-CoA transferase
VHRGELIPILSEIFAQRPRDYWALLLEPAGIPNGPIHTFDQVVADAQVQALGIVQQRPGSGLSLLGLPLSFDGARPPFTKQAPALGEDNERVLG